MEVVEVLRSEGLEETVLALGAINPAGDIDLGGAQRPSQAEEGRVKETVDGVTPTRPHGKDPV